jgi:hypothetical protein
LGAPHSKEPPAPVRSLLRVCAFHAAAIRLLTFEELHIPEAVTTADFIDVAATQHNKPPGLRHATDRPLKQSKVQKRGKLPRGNSAKRGKARKVAKSAKATKRTAKSKRAPAARPIKQPVAPAIETVAVEVSEQPLAVVDEASTDPAV